jgi:hypothetical protein
MPTTYQPTARLEAIRKKLKDRRLYLVADETGLSYQGIRYILTGRTKDPRDSTLTILEEYLNGRTLGQSDTVSL